MQRSCQCVGLSRSAWYYKPKEKPSDDAVIEAIHKVLESKQQWGFWKVCQSLRREHPWNHKRIYRVYRLLKLNFRNKGKKRLPARVKMPLLAPPQPNQTWSADFMSDALCSGRRFRTLNVLDDCNREVVHIEIDTSITGKRLIQVFERLRQERGLPQVLRTDNGPEFLQHEFVNWAQAMGMKMQYTQPGKPTQNAYIERFNRTYRNELLDLYMFRNLNEVREATYWWMIGYNEERPHDALNGMTPVEYLEKIKKQDSNFKLSS